MKWHLGRISLLAFQVVWLLAILPGHQRGVVTLPGSPAATCHTEAANATEGGGSSCCAPKSAPADPASPVQDPDRAAHCAVCHFAIRMVFLPPPDLTVAAAGLVDLLPFPPAANQFDRPITPTYDACGPPTA